MAKLAIYRDNVLDRHVELGDRDLLIGRGDQNDISLKDPEKTVSRFHAELRFEGGQYVILDLNSQNGTWVEGQCVQRAVLQPNVPVTVGGFTLVLEGAIRDHLDQILLINPDHAETLELKITTEEQLRQAKQAAAAAAPAVVTPSPAPAAKPSASVRPAPRRESAGAPTMARKTDESLADWRARGQDRQARYDKAKAALDRQDFALATAKLETLERDEPSYRDVALLVNRARAGLRADARGAVEAAETHEAVSEFTEAVKDYERARRLDPSLAGVTDAMDRLAARMRTEGEDAYKRARQYDALGRRPEAIALYERAIALLPADHPTRTLAKNRLEAVRDAEMIRRIRL